MIARLADRGEQTIAKLADLPGGTKALKAVNDLRERVDELGKKVRGIDELEKRVAKLERELATLKRAQKPKASAAARRSEGIRVGAPGRLRRRTADDGRRPVARGMQLDDAVGRRSRIDHEGLGVWTELRADRRRRVHGRAADRPDASWWTWPEMTARTCGCRARTALERSRHRGARCGPPTGSRPRSADGGGRARRCALGSPASRSSQPRELLGAQLARVLAGQLRVEADDEPVARLDEEADAVADLLGRPPGRHAEAPPGRRDCRERSGAGRSSRRDPRGAPRRSRCASSWAVSPVTTRRSKSGTRAADVLDHPAQAWAASRCRAATRSGR